MEGGDGSLYPPPSQNPGHPVPNGLCCLLPLRAPGLRLRLVRFLPAPRHPWTSPELWGSTPSTLAGFPSPLCSCSPTGQGGTWSRCSCCLLWGPTQYPCGSQTPASPLLTPQVSLSSSGDSPTLPLHIARGLCTSNPLLRLHPAPSPPQ